MLNTVERNKQREEWERRKREAPRGHVFEDADVVLRKAREGFEAMYRCNVKTYAECRDGPLIPQVIEALPVSSGRGQDHDIARKRTRKAQGRAK